MKTTTAFIAYFDILGFKQIVYTVSPNVLDRFYSNIMRDTQWAYANNGKQVGRIEIQPVFETSPIMAINVTDSIVFISQDDSEQSLVAILKAIKNFVTIADMYCGYRGSLVHGEFNSKLGDVKDEKGDIVYTSSAIYGKAAIEAYKKAEAQEWIGCFIDESVVKYASENGFSQNHFSNYVKYDVPFKKCKQNLLALKMTLSDSNGKSHEEQVKELFERNELKFTEQVRLKYENTLAFRKYCNAL